MSNVQAMCSFMFIGRLNHILKESGRGCRHLMSGITFSEGRFAVDLGSDFRHLRAHHRCSSVDSIKKRDVLAIQIKLKINWILKEIYVA